MDIHAVELSALRLEELAPLIEKADQLDLSQFAFVSLHAPSNLGVRDEEDVVARLQAIRSRAWPIVLHPDAIHQFDHWDSFGEQLLIENMDRRKPTGRTVSELAQIFEKLPRALLCFDIAHARQFDTTMTEAFLILKTFGDRVRQVHISEVNTSSRHDRLSYGAILAFQQVADLIPENVPVILETPVRRDQIDAEVARVREALPAPQASLVLAT